MNISQNCVDLLDHQVDQELVELQDLVLRALVMDTVQNQLQEPLDHQVHPVHQVHLDLLDLLVSQGILAPLVHLVQWALSDQLVRQECQELRDSMDTRAGLELRDLRENLVAPAHLEKTDIMDCPDPKEMPELQATLVLLDKKDLLDQLDHQVILANPDLQEHPERMDSLEPLDTLEQSVPQVQLGHLGLLYPLR